jgi:spermidine synthase
VHEVRSEYSHIRIYDRGSIRYLMFVRDNGQEVVESALDLRQPDLLEIDYTRTMFVSHLFRPEQQRILLIGLGGGSMVRFLRRFFPEVAITVVDIDPAIVEVAADYFGVTPAPNLEILAEDGFEFLARPGPRYDVIYMDAFLKPGMETDTEGAPLRMQTTNFLRSLQDRLLPGGQLVININVQEDTADDIATLREVYPQVYLFEGGGNLIAVGSMERERASEAQLRRNGQRLDARAQHGFSFTEMVDLRTDEWR